MFSLGVQHELSPSVIWVVQYVGNIAWHQNVIDNGLNAMSPSIGVVNIATPTAAANLKMRAALPVMVDQNTTRRICLKDQLYRMMPVKLVSVTTVG